MRTPRRGRGVHEGIDAGAESILLGGEILLLDDAIAPLSIRVVIQVIGLEKEGDLSGKGFNRGTRRNGPLRGSNQSSEHPASPEHRSGSAPFERRQGEISDRPPEVFRRGFCCLSGTYCRAPSDVTRRVEGGFVDGTVHKQQLDRVLRECVYR